MDRRVDGRVAGVSLRAQVCWEIPKVSSTASAHVLSRLAQDMHLCGSIFMKAPSLAAAPSLPSLEQEDPCSPHLGRKEHCACVGVEGGETQRQQEQREVEMQQRRAA